MPKKPIKLDPVDGFVVDEVGPWASEKHERLRRYINIASGARAKFIPPRGQGGASYIELYCGPGRSLVRDTTKIIDGSPLLAYKTARTSGARFSEVYLNDIDPDKSAAVDNRIRALGGAPICYAKSADVAVGQAACLTNLHLGWRNQVDLRQSIASLRAALLGIELVAGPNNQRLYWLVFVSAHELAQKLWDAIRDIRGQTTMGF